MVMISFDDAVNAVLARARRAGTERVPLSQALGRALPDPVRSPLDSPPFDKAAMDGYAVLSTDASGSFRVVDVVAAGASPRRSLGRGECAKIMTGAMMPPGADRVIRVEYAREDAGCMYPLRQETQSNVIPRGENLRAGDPVLTPRMLAVQDIGILASLGLAEIPVTIRPVVGIVTTGSELRSPGEDLGAGEIYDSNGAQLEAHVASAGCVGRRYGSVVDTLEAIRGGVEEAARVCDVLLLSGGVSMGDFDHVPQALDAAGYTVHFHKVSVRPGMPTLFAGREGKFVFGLPGNPVSTFVIFEVLVKPFLLATMGVPEGRCLARGVLAARVTRREADRVEFRPVRVDGGKVHPLGYHGPSHLNVLAEANGLVRIEAGTAALEEGAEVDVRQVR